VVSEAGHAEYDYTLNGYGHDSASFPIGQGGSFTEGEYYYQIRVESRTSSPESGGGPITQGYIGAQSFANIPGISGVASASASREVVYQVVSDPGNDPGRQVLLRVLATGLSSGSGTSTISAGGRPLAISNSGEEFWVNPGSTFAVSVATSAS
jgi:hypothetical protein